MVYFRLSEDEFQELNELCRSASARSISDVARQAVQNMLQTHRKPPSLEPVASVQSNMERLVEMVERLIQRVEPGPVREASAAPSEQSK